MLSDDQRQAIRHLVDQFDRLSESQRHAYSETDTRTNFIDPLFAALGWPMDDREHVERETTISEGKRPDYIFKLHGVPHLFLEAKRFTEDPRALQWAADAITKAYNKGVGWAAVTNFTDLVVYDAYELLIKESRPHKVLDLHYERYFDPDSPLYELSPHSLAERLMEKRAQEAGIRTKTIPIEKRLYESMRDWREKVINGMAQYQNWKTEAEYGMADEAVQRLIDRLLFLRHCEDRGIMDPELRSLLHRIRDRGRRYVRVTESLLRLFAQAADTFDSEIFQTDALTDIQFRSLAHITDFDDLLADVIRGLYSVPQSLAEYDFAQMEPDVLGEVYEQYLGYVPQRVRQLAAQPSLPGLPAQEIAIEAKRQRRKERGIYYTPRWVVQYIVQQTLGRFLEEHRDRPDVIDSVAILDPACGSGSFLIRAYETLLEYHAASMGGDIGHLDTRTRERILRCIFGVDLDPQAVEIARLNLLVRLVRQQELLPELKDNVRAGNSLIEGDEANLRPYFADGWEDKHPFNWESQFPPIMASGGFDIIIGNPPYVETSLIPSGERDYYRDHYETAYAGFDLYVIFMERALNLLKPGGYFSFITSGKFLRAQYGEKLCHYLMDHVTTTEIIDLSAQKEVFEGAINYPLVIVCRKQSTTKPFRYVLPSQDRLITALEALNNVVGEMGYDVDKAYIPKGIWPPPRASNQQLFKKLAAIPHRLGDIAELFHGLQTNADRVFILHKLADAANSTIRVRSKAIGQEHHLEAALLHPLLKGSVHMRRYRVDETDLLLLFPYSPGSSNLLPAEVIESSYPAIWNYLNLAACRTTLENREKGRWRGDPQWYGYSYRKNHDKFGTGTPRLLTPSIAAYASFSYDPEGHYYFVGSGGGGGGGYGVELKPDTPCSFLYLLALLNSQLLDWYLHQISSPFRGGYRAYNRQYISRLPIRLVSAGDPVHDRLATLATRMLDLHQRLATKGDLHDREREVIEREIAQTDRQIDDLVYDLYGLTAQERALVESEVRR